MPPEDVEKPEENVEVDEPTVAPEPEPTLDAEPVTDPLDADHYKAKIAALEATNAQLITDLTQAKADYYDLVMGAKSETSEEPEVEPDPAPNSDPDLDELFKD